MLLSVVDETTTARLVCPKAIAAAKATAATKRRKVIPRLILTVDLQPTGKPFGNWNPFTSDGRNARGTKGDLPNRRADPPRNGTVPLACSEQGKLPATLPGEQLRQLESVRTTAQTPTISMLLACNFQVKQVVKKPQHTPG